MICPGNGQAQPQTMKALIQACTKYGGAEGRVGAAPGGAGTPSVVGTAIYHPDVPSRKVLASAAAGSLGSRQP